MTFHVYDSCVPKRHSGETAASGVWISDHVDGSLKETLGSDVHTTISISSILPTSASAGVSGAFTAAGAGFEAGIVFTMTGVTLTVAGVNAGGTAATGTYAVASGAATGAQTLSAVNLVLNEATKANAFTILDA